MPNAIPHTPGPWTLRRLSFTTIAVHAGFELIGYVDGQQVEADQLVANARLIEAAPDLYAQLALLVEACREPRLDPMAASETVTVCRVCHGVDGCVDGCTVDDARLVLEALASDVV